MVSIHASNAGIIQPCQSNVPSKVKLMLHHQFPGIELVSPTYVGDGVTCCLSPDQIVDTGSTMQTGFSIDSARAGSISALTYKLQRKNVDQFNEETISSEEATCVQLFMIWMVNSFKEFCVVLSLLEHDKDCIWGRDELMKLAKYRSEFSIQHGFIEETWLMHDSTVLMTRMNVTREAECYKLEITISESSINKDTQRLWYIDMDR
jgi:hypothetical protein